MAKGHLPGIGSGGQGQKLVPQAHGEEGEIAVIQGADLPDDLRVVRRVPGTVGEHHPVKTALQNGAGGSVGGIDGHLAAPVLEAADHILLDAVVHQRYPHPLHPNGGIHLGNGAGNPFHGALHPIRPDPGQTVLHMKMLRTGDHAVHGPLTAEYAGQCAGVHALDPGDIIFF